MKNKTTIYVLIIILSISFIIIDKFILKSGHGWLDTIPFIFCIIFLIYSSIKLYQLSRLDKVIKIILELITILIIIWFSLLSIDYKRHKNLYEPLFNIGYEVIQDYDMNIETGGVCKNKSTFYLLGIRINEVYMIEN